MPKTLARDCDRKKLFTCFALAWCIAAAARGQEAPSGALDPDQPYAERAELLSPIHYDVDFSIVVTPPYKCKSLKVWLPLPQSDRVQTATGSELSTFPQKREPVIGVEPLFGNKFAYFEFKEPQGAQVIRHKFHIKTHEVRWRMDAAKIPEVAQWPDGFAPYRRNETQAVVFDDRLKKLLAQIIPQRQSVLTDLTAVMTWTEDHFTYDHHDASLRADSRRALEKRRGHCSDYHGFCAALGRAMGYPTRVAYGINPFPKNSPSHCKLECFIPGHGWVSFDVSETQKLIAAIRKDEKLSAERKTSLAQAASDRLASGFRDNTWFCLTRGTDYDLAPPARQRVAVVRTAYIEADGVALPDPDPADAQKREFAWMTVHEYQADQPAPNPFQDYKTLQP